MQGISDLPTLLAQMEPVLQSGRYVFVSLPAETTIDPARVVASIREPEGLSVVLPESVARDQGLPITFVTAWITLAIHSDLAAVGLTAAFSQALGEAGISCNVIAGVRHDHLFVPIGQTRQAMDTLNALSQTAAAARE